MNNEYFDIKYFSDFRKNILIKLDALRTTRGLNPMTIASSVWLRSLINEYRVVPDSSKKYNLSRYGVASQTKKQHKRIGEMFFFHYRPDKNANEYWDAFPLVFITKVTKDGFYGINLHYLPPKHREILFRALVRLAVPKGEKYFSLEESDRMRLSRVKVTYEMLKKMKRYRFFRPCYKKYKYSRIYGNMLLIEPKFWDIAMFLPLASFKGITKRALWKKSRDQLKE